MVGKLSQFTRVCGEKKLILDPGKKGVLNKHLSLLHMETLLNWT